MFQKQMLLSLWVVSCCTLLLSGCLGGNLEGIGTLKDLAKEEKIQKAALTEDDRNFQKIKEAISRQRLKTNLAGDEISSRYGNPVTRVPQGPDSRWIYKLSEGDLLSGPKIYLLFDGNNRLKSWECIRVACSSES